MNALDARFQQLRSSQRKAFIPFLTAGDPDIGFTEKILPKVAEAGADVIEIGFPFSDPIADGPVIQASYTRALDRGLKLGDIFSAVGRVTSTKDWQTPLVGMVSYSLVFRHGPKLFLEDAKKAGFSGLIVPDLTAEEADDFAKQCADHDVRLILLVTPTTPPQRVERIVKICTGFLYCVSVVGITGERDRLPTALRDQLAKFRSMTDLPLCVGFGVSKPEHVKELKDIADGVIVGSALVRKLDQPNAADEVVRSVRELSKALHD